MMDMDEKKYLRHEQYATDMAYSARARLFAFGDNPQGLWQWLAANYNFATASRILEVGCGTAGFWKNAAHKISKQQRLLLTDLSTGMLNIAEQSLKNLTVADQIQYCVADVEDIPLPNNSIDGVLAHLILYYATSNHDALNEIKRVLAPNGWVGICVPANYNFQEIFGLVNQLDKSLPLLSAASNFCEEISDRLLPNYFSKIEKYKYETTLYIPYTMPIMQFIRTYPDIQKRALSNDFFLQLEAAISHVIHQHTFYKMRTRFAHYICHQ